MQRNYLIPLALLAAVALAGCQHTTPRQQYAAATPQAAQPAPVSQDAARQQQASVDFRLAQTQAAPGLSELKLSDGSLWLLPEPVLTRADLASVEPRKTQQGQAYVRFGFSQAGAQKLAALSQRYPGKLLVLTLNNSLIAAPRIQGAITNGVLDVGFASDQQALNVAREIAGQGSAG